MKACAWRVVVVIPRQVMFSPWRAVLVIPHWRVNCLKSMNSHFDVLRCRHFMQYHFRPQSVACRSEGHQCHWKINTGGRDACMYDHEFFPKPLPHYAWLSFVVDPIKENICRLCCVAYFIYTDTLTELMENAFFSRFTEPCGRYF